MKTYVVLLMLLGFCMISCRPNRENLLQERVQQADKPENRGIVGKPYSISRVSPDFQVMEEYLIPSDLGVLPYLIFMENRLMLNRPYKVGTEGSALCFYGIAFAPVTGR